MTILECSGLVTLVSKRLSYQNAFYFTLPKESGFATTVDFQIFAQYLMSRKVLILDVKKEDSIIRLVNTHLTPFTSAKEENLEQNRQLR